MPSKKVEWILKFEYNESNTIPCIFEIFYDVLYIKMKTNQYALLK